LSASGVGKSDTLLAGHANLDDEFGGVGVFLPKILFPSSDHGEIGFRLRVRAGDGLVLANAV